MFINGIKLINVKRKLSINIIPLQNLKVIENTHTAHNISKECYEPGYLIKRGGSLKVLIFFTITLISSGTDAFGFYLEGIIFGHL